MVATEGWDYIIAGGGLAGCVVASRLKQYQNSARILIVEAGPDVSGNKEILHFMSLFPIGDSFDWGYKTVPQKGYGGRQVDIASGRALGGGSVINKCGWFRGSRADYDSWGEAVGDQRWSYDGQLPYFKMTEKWFNGVDSKSHGRDGKLQIESPISTNRIYPLAGILERAWEEFGVHKLPGGDYNAGANIGFGYANENRANGARQIAPSVYSLDGITVMTDTLVGSILVDKDNKATGIRLSDGTEIQGSKVIAAAGAYRTPQLLMLSGLGPKATLEKHGIETKVDIPEVGKNFNDHVILILNWKLKDPLKGYALGSNNPLFSEPRFATGVPITHIVCTQVPRHDLEATIARDEGKDKVDPNHYLLKREWAMMENMVMYLPVPPVQADGTHIGTVLMGLKPTSRGTVTIASDNPADSPVLDPNYFATEVDKLVWRYSLRNIAAFMTGDTPLGREIVECETPFPGFEPLTVHASDEYLDNRVKTHGESTFHGCGTCSMGTVVDTDLRVKGVQNLWVVDASVIPISIGAHIQAAVYALAEQAAVIIAQEKGVRI
ncbi:GMC oxidoreductase [Xylariaceae sp. FL0662B]|nr:GMC oxidoreductase [Xylariaceae sp. FL0662B]